MDNKAAYLANQAGDKYDLNNDESVLGRHPECDVQIEAGAVSRRHARILYREGGYFLEDLKSRNFTYLNEKRVENPTQLRNGDRLSVCDIVFTFHDPNDDSPPLEMDSSSLFRTEIVEDEGSHNTASTIMKKLDVSSSRGRIQLTASPEVKLKALLEITHNLGRALSLDQVLPTVLESLFKIFVQADRGFIGLKAEDGTLIPRWTKARREEAEDTMRISRTIVNGVMESKEAILSADAATDERFEMSQSIADFRIRSMMCAPLFDTEGNVLGVLQIDTLDQRKRFQDGDLEVLASIASQAGISINNAQMYEQAIKQKGLQRDLALAHEVQHSFLPTAPPQLDDYEFFDFYRPASFVGGDYYDYIDLPGDRTAVIVADVVGHGVAAALLMAKLSAEARFSLGSEPVPAKAVTILNDRLSRLQIDRFVTMVMTVLDPKNHTVTIVNAGHMPPIFRRADGTIEEPGEEISGLPLGIMEDVEYQQSEVFVAPGESLTMYTDGINECQGVAGEDYSIERIRNWIRQSPVSPNLACKAILDDVDEYLGASEQEDDMCVVAFARR